MNAPEETTGPALVPRPEAAGAPTAPFSALLRYFLRLGTLGFGGPIAVVGYMQRDLVEQRGWIARQDFLDGVALGQTMPGPLAAQVAIWVGYLKRGALGAAAVAVAFIAPSFAMVVAVAAIYAHYSGLSIVGSLFYGIAPAVMAIIAIAAYKLVRLTDGTDKRAWAISAAVFAVTATTGREPVYLIVGAGLLLILLDGAVVVLTRQAVTDLATAAIALATLALLLRFRKIPEPYVVAAAGTLGILLH